MKKILAAAFGAALLFGAQAANAGFIQVGLQAPGTNSGNITVEHSLDTNSGFLNWPASVLYGGFNTSGNAQDGDYSGPPNVLFSQSLDTSTSTGGDLTVIIASQGLTQPFGPGTSWETSMNSNDFNNITVTMSAYLDLGNHTLNDFENSVLPTPSSTFLLLGTANLSGHTGPSSQADFINSTDINAPFSVFEVYHVVASNPQTFNLSISEVATVPTPAPLAILGLGLAALAGVTRFRKSGARA